MAKDNLPKKNEKNDEYHFTEDVEESPIIGQPVGKPKRTGIKRLLYNRTFIVLLILIVAVAIVYQFVGRKKSIREETIDIAQPAISPAPEARQPVPSIVTPTTAVMPTPAAQSLESQVSDLNQQVQQNQNQIQQLQNSMQQMQNSMSQLTNQVSTLSDNISTLTQTISKPAPVAVTVKPKPVYVKPRPRIFYYVRAVIPGRAWLQAMCGPHVVKTVSVAVGDYLPGYGTVTAINSTRGTVSVDNGTVIRFRKIANGI